MAKLYMKSGLREEYETYYFSECLRPTRNRTFECTPLRCFEPNLPVAQSVLAEGDQVVLVDQENPEGQTKPQTQ